MAISEAQRMVETYNYASFTRSESAGKSDEFKSSLRAGEEAPDFELPTLLGERVRLSFEDNGIGIDPASQQRIFEVFQRAYSGGQYEGSGLGLAIVRKAVERMGGTVGVQSELGRGSRFWLELPKA